MDLDLEPTPPANTFKYVMIVVLIALVAACGYLLMTRGSREQSRTEVEKMEAQLNVDQAALNGQRDRLVEMSRELEGLKQMIDTGTAADRKQAAADYAKYAKEQRAVREEYLKMEAAYNEKAVAYQKLKSEEE